MPTVISHSIFSAGIARWFRFVDGTKLLIASIILAALPDTDTILMGIFGHDSIFRHRGILHSVFFALLTSDVTLLLFKRKKWVEDGNVWKLGLLFYTFAISHPLLDGFSTGGTIGVAYFAPLDNTRYVLGDLLPLAPLAVSRLFTARGVHLFLTEAGMLWTFTIGSYLWAKSDERMKYQKLFAVIVWTFMLVLWIGSALNY